MCLPRSQISFLCVGQNCKIWYELLKVQKVKIQLNKYHTKVILTTKKMKLLGLFSLPSHASMTFIFDFVGGKHILLGSAKPRTLGLPQMV